MMVTKCMCFIILIQLVVLSKSAKILAVLPVPVISHQMVFRVLTQELAKRGHEVTIITALPVYKTNEAPFNYTEIDISEVADRIIKKLVAEDLALSKDVISQFVSTFKAGSTVIVDMLMLKEIQILMKNKREHFDIIFLEDCARGTLIFSHIFKAPVIQISSFGGTFGTFEAVGALTHPIIYPLAIRNRYRNLSTWEKISELHMEYRLHKAFSENEMWENEVFRKRFGRNTPSIHELQGNIHMLFLNIHPIWDSNRPVPPNVIYLGGLHQKPKRQLPEELESSVNSSKNGVIYVSFGTNVNPALISPEKLQIFFNVFSKLPYDIYWKWNDEDRAVLAKNIKVSKWFPQSDLLQHPKIKLFITQGGLQSTDEAIAGGVPLIGIPMIWDQGFNVDKYVQLKIGLHLDISSLTETKLKSAIDEVLGDERYKENIVKLRAVMRDQIQTPLERAVWWTEYVIRNRGAQHLRASTANMSWVEYYEIKLILFFIIISILILVMLILITLRILRMFTYKIKTD